MKKIILPVLILLTVFACNNNQVTITGKIANPLEGYITIQAGEMTDTVFLADDGSFSTELNIETEGLAYIKNGRLRISLYLIPGTQMNMDFDIEDFNDDTVTDEIFSGDGSQASAFLFTLRGKNLQEGFQETMEMPVEIFESKINHADDVLTKEIEKFKTEKSPSQKFIETMTLLKDIDLANKYLYYIKYHSQYVPSDKTSIPDSSEEFFQKIPVQKYDRYKNIVEFKNFIDALYGMKINKKLHSFQDLKRGTLAYANKYIDVISGLDIPDGFKNQLGQSFLQNYIQLPDSIQAVYESRYKELLFDKKTIHDFEKIIATVEKTRPGNKAPSFNLPDIDGNMVSSESLKGKVVFINVWASDCGPCISDITYLQKMRSDVQGQPIAIVEISIDADKKAWEKMVKKEKLGGIQLFAKGVWGSEIVSDYAIKEIPRHIIIDKEGIIVDPNASFAANPATLKKLLELAKE